MRLSIVRLSIALALAPALWGCAAPPPPPVAADSVPVPYPPPAHWPPPGAAPERVLPPRLGFFFRRTGLRGDATWMQAEYQGGDAVVQVTATPRCDAATRRAALALLRAAPAPAADGPRRLAEVSEAPFWAITAADPRGAYAAICWEYGGYTLCARLLTPHDSATVRLFLAGFFR